MPDLIEEPIVNKAKPDIPERLWERLILISGHRRSGTTWLAAALGKARDVKLIPHEPLWLKWHSESPHTEAIRRWRSGQAWYLYPNRSSADDVATAQTLQKHLAWLCNHYFGGPVGTLIIKEPHPNWLEFLMFAFQPDQVIYLLRHPIGIVNSYDKAGLYHRWHVGQEWVDFSQQLPKVHPELVKLAKNIRHPAEQVAFMAHTCTILQAKVLANVPAVVVDYETLGITPEKSFKELYQGLGLRWEEDTWDQLKPIVEPDLAEIEHGFRYVKKRSEARVYAWRRELSPRLIGQVTSLLKMLNPDYPYPGQGLPPLTLQEILAGWKTYLQRRKAYVRQFGWRASRLSL